MIKLTFPQAKRHYSTTQWYLVIVDKNSSSKVCDCEIDSTLVFSNLVLNNVTFVLLPEFDTGRTVRYSKSHSSKRKVVR